MSEMMTWNIRILPYFAIVSANIGGFFAEARIEGEFVTAKNLIDNFRDAYDLACDSVYADFESMCERLEREAIRLRRIIDADRYSDE